MRSAPPQTSGQFSGQVTQESWHGCPSVLRPMANPAYESRQNGKINRPYPLDATATTGTIPVALVAIGVPVLAVMPKCSRPVLLRRGGGCYQLEYRGWHCA